MVQLCFGRTQYPASPGSITSAPTGGRTIPAPAVPAGGAAGAPVIQLCNISKVYGSGDRPVMVLKQINLDILAGEYCAIMGRSGSGKSTLMNIMGCLDQPTSGRYTLASEAVGHRSPAAMAQIRNRQIGFVFQQFHLLPQLTALENVMLPLSYTRLPEAEQRQRAAIALDRVGLGDRLSHTPGQLSGGQQQRVAIARAIVNQPVLLLADEPTGALDAETTADVLALFADLNQDGTTLVLVTHDLEVANQAHRIISLQDGHLIED